MNLFENLRLLNEAKKNIEFQNLFEMAKLIPKRADETICGKLDVYIYFSKAKGGDIVQELNLMEELLKLMIVIKLQQ